MYNPLLEDPTKLKNEDLDKKIQDLTKKYWIAARMGQGAVCEQIGIALELYKSEQQIRIMSATQKTLGNGDKNLDGLINVD